MEFKGTIPIYVNVRFETKAARLDNDFTIDLERAIENAVFRDDWSYHEDFDILRDLIPVGKME